MFLRNKVFLDFSHESEKWRGAVPQIEKLSRRIAKLALDKSHARPERGAEIGIVLSDDRQIRALNKKWRGMDKATNVLSFETGDGLLLGDVVISIDAMSREAKARGKTPAAHYAHLLAHGILHLLGFDHANDTDAGEMESCEAEILGELGFENPYE
jgi:probable rRNA maturation factor